MSYASKYPSNLCLLVLKNEPKEIPTYPSVTEFLYSNGFTPIEVHSSGQALIQTRQVKFFLIIVPDDDHDLIKKIKSYDGKNFDSIVIVVSSTSDIQETTQELFNQSIIQNIVHMSDDLDVFQKSIIETVKAQLLTADNALSNQGAQAVFQPQQPPVNMAQYSQSEQLPFPSIVASQLYSGLTTASQSSPHQQLFCQTNHMQCSNQPQQLLQTNQSYPLHAFTLIPPMVVPYHALLQNINSSPHGNDCYIMPRIVDFGSPHGKMIRQVQQALSFADPTKTDLISSSDKTQLNPNNNINGLGSEIPCVNELQDKDENSTKLPSIAKLLESLTPRPKNSDEQTSNEDNEIASPKRPRVETGNKRVSSVEEQKYSDNTEDETKNPLSAHKARPYFVNLDGQMEDIAFDPKVKSSDRHNAKERHRRIRITKATEFFKENIPCMLPNMDKATALNLTVYYIMFLRDALRKIDPKIIRDLHKSYKEEWQSYFEKVTTTGE